jgi:tetratricopeptide (TPR) repeat protein
MKNFDEAEKILNEALIIQKKINGEEHRSVTNIYEKLGEINLEKGNFIKAEILFNKALNINYKILGEKHFAYASDLISLSKVKAEMKDYNAAIELCNRGIETAISVGGKESSFLTGTYSILAKIYKDKGDYVTSDSLYRISIRMYDKIYGRNYIRTALTMTNFGSLLLQMDSVKQAYNYANEGLKILKSDKEFDPINIARAEGVVGEILTSMKSYEQAEKLLLNSYNNLKKVPGNNKPEKESLNRLIKLYKAWGKDGELKKYQLALVSL